MWHPHLSYDGGDIPILLKKVEFESRYHLRRMDNFQNSMINTQKVSNPNNFFVSLGNIEGQDLHFILHNHRNNYTRNVGFIKLKCTYIMIMRRVE